MPKKPCEEFIEAVANFFFYLFSFFIVLLPPLFWLSRVFSEKSGVFWVLVSIVVFVFILPNLIPTLADRLVEPMQRIKKGELLRPIFVPLRAFSSVLGIYGVLKLEYVLIHGMPAVQGETWLELMWQFLKTF